MLGNAFPRQQAICAGRVHGHTRGLFPQCGASWLTAFSWMPEPLGSCALCPTLDYKLPPTLERFPLCLGRLESRSPRAGADASDVLLCRLSPALAHSSPNPATPCSQFLDQFSGSCKYWCAVSCTGGRAAGGRGEACATGTHPSLGGMWNHWAHILVAFQKAVFSETSWVYF